MMKQPHRQIVSPATLKNLRKVHARFCLCEKRKPLTDLSLQLKFVMEKLPMQKEQGTRICLRMKKMSWTVGLSR